MKSMMRRFALGTVLIFRMFIIDDLIGAKVEFESTVRLAGAFSVGRLEMSAFRSRTVLHQSVLMLRAELSKFSHLPSGAYQRRQAEPYADCHQHARPDQGDDAPDAHRGHRKWSVSERKATVSSDNRYRSMDGADGRRPDGCGGVESPRQRPEAICTLLRPSTGRDAGAASFVVGRR